MNIHDLLLHIAHRLANLSPDRVAGLIIYLLQSIDCFATDHSSQAEINFTCALDSISADIQDRIQSGGWL